MKITVGIPTKDRYDSLSHTLLSIALQTHPPHEIIIVDDSDYLTDIREFPVYHYILRLLDDKDIKWKVVFGEKKGQHYSHQKIQEIAEGDYVFRIDDDCIAEPDVLRRLKGAMKINVGAVAPAVLMPNPHGLPHGVNNRIKNISTQPNMQWYLGTGTHEVEHLYSCFLYRKNIVKYDLNLSTVAHREETIFSHSIHRAGYKLLVNMDAHVHHFRSEEGGIRTFKQDSSLWTHDEKIFMSYLNIWGVNTSDSKYVVLDNGLGDHYAFKNILPELRKQDKTILIACCYPDVFHDEADVKLMSIAQAKLLFGNIDTYNIYRFMGERNWKGTLTEAFKQLYI